MGWDNKYPYNDFHEMNLDWFLQRFKEVTNQVTTLDATVQRFTEFVTNYFNNLDVQEEINNKLEAMKESGELSELIQPLFDEFTVTVNQALENQDDRLDLQDNSISVLQSRMDSFVHLTDGSTTGDAELADIRIGYDGQTYATAGDAVRVQVKDLNNLLSGRKAYGVKYDTLRGAIIQNTDNLNELIKGEYNFIREEFIRQKSVYSADASGIHHSASTGACTLKYPIPVEAGVTYQFYNIYGLLSFVIYSDNSYAALSASGTLNLSGTFTATMNGLVYITFASNDGGLNPYSGIVHTFQKSGTAYIWDPSTSEFVFSNYLNDKYLGYNTVPVDRIESDIWDTQFLKSDDFVNNNCAYQIANNCIRLYDFGSGANCGYYVKPIRIKAGHTYYFEHLYGLFCQIHYDDDTVAALTASTTTDYTGSFTPVKDGRIYITASSLYPHHQFSTGPVPASYTEGAYRVKTDGRKVITVDINGTGDYTSLTEGIANAIQYENAKVYVKVGTYNIITEYEALYGNTFFTAFDASTPNVGIVLANGVEVIFAPNAFVECEYTGTNTYVQNRFSPFNSGANGFTLKNLNIKDKNVRYSVHDERGSDTDIYENRYESCIFNHDKGTGSGYIQAIGGGLGKNGYVVFDGCIVNSEGSTDRIFSYHNSGTADARSQILVKNCIINGGIRFSYYGTSTYTSTMNVTNCKMKALPIVSQESASFTTVNVEINEWNNLIA